jgi:hypothetical protein
MKAAGKKNFGQLALSEAIGVNYYHRVPTPTPTYSTRGKEGRNHLNEKITPLLPTGIGEQYSQTKSNLGHAPMGTPSINESAELTQGALYTVVNSAL